MSKHHQELNDLGEGKCSVPMWSMGGPAGFCDKPAYGVRPPGKQFYNIHTQEMLREDGRYAGYVPGLACVGHGGPAIRSFMDGDQWCAVNRDFINLQESAAGFGDTREQAIAALSATGAQP